MARHSWTRDRSIPIDNRQPLTTFIHMACNSVLKRAHTRITLVGSCYTGSSGNPVLAGKPNVAAGKVEKEFLERGTRKGPLLFHGMMTHLDMLDFRHIVDCMCVQWYDNLMQVKKLIDGKYQGVRINCVGDTYISGRQDYESMSITDGFFTSHCPLDVPVSRLVAMPLLVNRMNEMLPWKGPRISGDGSVTYGINIHSKELNPGRWAVVSGSLSVVREDRKPLHPAHIDALVDYCAEVGGSRKIV